MVVELYVLVNDEMILGRTILIIRKCKNKVILENSQYSSTNIGINKRTTQPYTYIHTYTVIYLYTGSCLCEKRYTSLVQRKKEEEKKLMKSMGTHTIIGYCITGPVSFIPTLSKELYQNPS